MMHSSTVSAATPARATAARTTIAPSCVALNSASVPWNFPTAVLTALTITTSRMHFSLFVAAACCSRARRSIRFELYLATGTPLRLHAHECDAESRPTAHGSQARAAPQRKLAHGPHAHSKRHLIVLASPSMEPHEPRPRRLWARCLKDFCRAFSFLLTLKFDESIPSLAT